MKLTVKCEDFRPLRRNTLCGFASVFLQEIGLRIKDLSIHEKNQSRWASLPSKPMLKNEALMKDAEGKAQYASILEFPERAVRDAFSAAVVRAVIEHSSAAFEREIQDRLPLRTFPSDNARAILP
jgi:hypothetical protein